jgi:hypothetical protein
VSTTTRRAGSDSVIVEGTPRLIVPDEARESVSDLVAEMLLVALEVEAPEHAA